MQGTSEALRAVCDRRIFAVGAKKGMKKNAYIIGIDEVGRGALAGPVMVAAALVPARRTAWLTRRTLRELGPLKDSKKLTAAQREAWTEHFRGSDVIRVALARVYPRGIERLNISQAANRAASRALASLMRSCSIDPGKTPVFLDGGLFLGSRSVQARAFPRAKTIVKGDEKIPAVAAASVMAKVARDRFMVKLARRYPAYSFEIHKGYATAKHRQALKKSGPCDAHRLTFLSRKPMIDGKSTVSHNLLPWVAYR